LVAVFWFDFPQTRQHLGEGLPYIHYYWTVAWQDWTRYTVLCDV